MTIWIPKSLLKESNIEQKVKLTFKLRKVSTSSSSKSILPFYAPKSQPLLSIHHIPSRIPSFTFLPSYSHPSRCVLKFILPSFPSILSQSFHSLSFYLLPYILFLHFPIPPIFQPHSLFIKLYVPLFSLPSSFPYQCI